MSSYHSIKTITMNKRLKRCTPLLRQLLCASRAGRAHVLANNREIIDCLCECAKNVIKGNIHLTPAQKQALASRKHSLRTLALKKTSLTTSKHILHSGGFLGGLLGPIVSVLGGVSLAAAAVAIVIINNGSCKEVDAC